MPNKFRLRRGGLCCVPTPNPSAPRARIPPFQRFFHADGKLGAWGSTLLPQKLGIFGLSILWQRSVSMAKSREPPGESSRRIQLRFWGFFGGGCFEAILSLAARLYLGTGEQPAELLLEKRRSFFGISPPKSAPPHPCEPSSGAPGFPGWF